MHRDHDVSHGAAENGSVQLVETVATPNDGEVNLEVAVDRSLPPGPASPPPRHFDKDAEVEKFEKRLLTVKRLALLSTCLYSLNWFLGICALTWISIGGFLTQLHEHDFYRVSGLLLLEALRRAAATFFGNLFTRKIIHRSTLHRDLKYHDREKNRILEGARIVDLIFQLLVLALSLYLPWHHLPSLPAKKSSARFDGLLHSLWVFYVLILLNAIIAAVGVLHSKALVPWFTTSFSLCRYYDHVVWRGMHKGLLYSTDFDFFAFAFKALADEYRRYQRAPVVYSLHRDLIIYLYSHKRGYDAARIAMDSSDLCEQEAAANIVGLWAAEIEGAGSSLLLQSRLLTKLADTLDHQETGRAATSSFESIAKSNAEGLLEVENEKGEKLMGILRKCIGKAVKAKKEDKALVFIKVLIQLLGSEAGREEAVGREGEAEAVKAGRKLVEDLEKVFKGEGCKKRTVGVAGRALKMMGKEPTEEMVDTWLRNPLPHEEEHILRDEEVYLLELLGQRTLPLLWKKKARVRPDTWPPASSAHSVSLPLSFVLLVALGLVLFYKPFNFQRALHL